MECIFTHLMNLPVSQEELIKNGVLLKDSEKKFLIDFSKIDERSLGLFPVEIQDNTAIWQTKYVEDTTPAEKLSLLCDTPVVINFLFDGYEDGFMVCQKGKKIRREN